MKHNTKHALQRLLLIFSMLLVFLCFGLSAQAASPKLSKKSLTLTVKKSATLTLKNTKKTVKWSASNKRVTIKKLSKNKVRITAKKKGTVKVTARVGKKKYTCRITVKAAPKKPQKPAPVKKDPATTFTPEKTFLDIIVNLNDKLTLYLPDGAVPVKWDDGYEMTQNYLHPSSDKSYSTISTDRAKICSVWVRYTLNGKEYRGQARIRIIKDANVGVDTHVYDRFASYSITGPACPVGGAHHLIRYADCSQNHDSREHFDSDYISDTDDEIYSAVFCTKCAQTTSHTSAMQMGLTYEIICREFWLGMMDSF